MESKKTYAETHCEDFFGFLIDEFFSGNSSDYFKNNAPDLLNDCVPDVEKMSKYFRSVDQKKLQSNLPPNYENICRTKLKGCFLYHFEKCAVLYPTQTLVCDDQEISYFELHCRANQMSHWLYQNVGSFEKRIGLFMTRGIDWVVTLFAIWKSGNAAVLVDAERKGNCVQDDRVKRFERAKTDIVICDNKFVSILNNKVQCIQYGAIQKECEIKFNLDKHLRSRAYRNEITANQLAYIIFTSGSTNEPKGVKNKHGGLVAVLSAFIQDVKLDRHDICAQQTSPNFDPIIFELLPLGIGCKIIIVNEETKKQPVLYRSLFQKSRTTVVTLTPSLFEAYQGLSTFCHVKKMYLVGEIMQLVFLKRFRDQLAKIYKNVGKLIDFIIVNGYGNTEATIFTSSFPIHIKNLSVINNLIRKLEELHFDQVPIGTPIHGVRWKLINQAKCEEELVDLFKKRIGKDNFQYGEIVFEGDNIGLGYLDDEMTKESFKDVDGDKKTYFFTNDLAIKLPNTLEFPGVQLRAEGGGNFLFLCRYGRQVKYNGVFINLEHIETTLNEQACVENCAVILFRDEKALTMRLIAYVQLGEQHIIPNTLPAMKREIRDALLVAYRTTYRPISSIIIEFIQKIPLSEASGSKKSTQKLQEDYKKRLEEKSKSCQKLCSDEPLSKAIIDAWNAVLDVPLTEEDRFIPFIDLGMSSLLAVRLVYELYNRNLTEFISVKPEFIQNMCYEDMMAVLQKDRLVDLIKGDNQIDTSSNRILFMIHTLLGDPTIDYAAMLSNTVKRPDGWNYFGLISPFIASDGYSSNSLNSLAENYVLLIRSKQPRGPYFVAGMSFGGILAAIVSAKLEKLDEQVFCFVLDSMEPSMQIKKLKENGARRKAYFETMFTKISKHFGMNAVSISDLITEEMSFELMVQKVFSKMLFSVKTKSSVRQLNSAKKLLLLLNSYQGYAAPTNMKLFIATKKDGDYREIKDEIDEKYYWKCSHLDSMTFDADHFGLVKHETFRQCFFNVLKRLGCMMQVRVKTYEQLNLCHVHDPVYSGDLELVKRSFLHRDHEQRICYVVNRHDTNSKHFRNGILAALFKEKDFLGFSIYHYSIGEVDRNFQDSKLVDDCQKDDCAIVVIHYDDEYHNEQKIVAKISSLLKDLTRTRVILIPKTTKQLTLKHETVQVVMTDAPLVELLKFYRRNSDTHDEQFIERQYWLARNIIRALVHKSSNITSQMKNISSDQIVVQNENDIKIAEDYQSTNETDALRGFVAILISIVTVNHNSVFVNKIFGLLQQDKPSCDEDFCFYDGYYNTTTRLLRSDDLKFFKGLCSNENTSEEVFAELDLYFAVRAYHYCHYQFAKKILEKVVSSNVDSLKSKAFFYLARMAQKSRGCEKNHQKAYELLLSAIKMPQPTFRAFLALAYAAQFGNGCVLDAKQAQSYYSQARTLRSDLFAQDMFDAYLATRVDEKMNEDNEHRNFTK